MEISEAKESEGLPLIQTESIAPPNEAETLNLE
jgi:hypothetical protein